MAAAPACAPYAARPDTERQVEKMRAALKAATSQDSFVLPLTRSLPPRDTGPSYNKLQPRTAWKAQYARPWFKSYVRGRSRHAARYRRIATGRPLIRTREALRYGGGGRGGGGAAGGGGAGGGGRGGGGGWGAATRGTATLRPHALARGSLSLPPHLSGTLRAGGTRWAAWR